MIETNSGFKSLDGSSMITSLYGSEAGNMLQIRPLAFAPYLLINVYTVKTRQVRLFIRLKPDLHSCATFPPVQPAARCQRAFCRGQRGPIGGVGIHKQRGGEPSQGYCDGGPRHTPRRGRRHSPGVLPPTSHARTHGKGMRGLVAGQVRRSVR